MSGAPAQALNAPASIPPDHAEAGRRARHLCMLQELAELGMALARVAAQQALEQGSRPPAEAAPAHAPAAAGRAAGPRPDSNVAFARLSREVRQTIALEARIAAGDLGPAPQRQTLRTPQRRPADPRLKSVRGILRAAAEADGAAKRALWREIDERLDDLPEADLDGMRTAEIIDTICGELGLDVDPATPTDEELDLVAGCGKLGPGTDRPGTDRPGTGRPDTGRPDDRGETRSPPLRPSGPDPP